jgi:hypothetical protein
MKRLSQNSIWSGLSALFTCCDSFPGALPQAGIERAFGALKPDFKAVKAPKARTIPAQGNALGMMPKKDQGLKARSIKCFELADRWHFFCFRPTRFSGASSGAEEICYRYPKLRTIWASCMVR